MQIHRRLRLIAVAFVVSQLSACVGKDCNDEGCGHPLQVDLRPASGGTIPPGEYVLVATTDGTPHVLTCDLSGTTVFSCAGSNAIVTGYILNGSAGVDRLMLDFNFRPAHVDLTLELSGAQVFSTTLTPDYQTSHPNGEDCGPECKSASAELAF